MTYLSDNFMLGSPTGRTLYHECAAELPIVDFHCHIEPAWVAGDKTFNDLAELWVCHDPYKWRAMRINGISEQRITGDATAWQKFEAWATTVPQTVGNPLFHWSGQELKRFFDVDQMLSLQSAESIWLRCNERLRDPAFSTRGLLERLKVETLCTSDDVLDTLAPHSQMRRQSGIQMLPSLRADRLIAVSDPGFRAFCIKLGNMTGIVVKDLESYEAAVRVRLDRFDALGCRLADVGLDQPVFAAPGKGMSSRHFAKALDGGTLDTSEKAELQTALLLFLGEEYHRRDWAMQLHIGAQRTTSHRLQHRVGAAGGYACIGKSSDVGPLVAFLNHLEMRDALPRTVLYTLNPSDMDMYASVTGSFAQDGIVGKVQFGPAWWLNDNRDGIERQLKALSNMGLLSRHIGMTTDSRSLLSYSRHEYYRRILCSLIGSWVDMGELPRDMDLIFRLIRNLCYSNAKNWLAPKGRKAGHIQSTP